jgi:hypothetical protein
MDKKEEAGTREKCQWDRTRSWNISIWTYAVFDEEDDMLLQSELTRATVVRVVSSCTYSFYTYTSSSRLLQSTEDE